MARLADFHQHPAGKFGGNPEAGTENFQDQGVAHPDEFHPAADTHTQRFQPLRVFVIRIHLTHDRTNP